MAAPGVVAVVGCAAGGVEELRPKLVAPMVEVGHTVAVTLTPTAHEWLTSAGEVNRLAALTGLPVSGHPRMSGDARPHPPADAFVVAPATANTVAKLALGIADNQALAMLCEGMGATPMVVFPRINAAHSRHPAWDGHLDALRSAGVHLVYGDDVWPLYEPRTAPPDRDLPWQHLCNEVQEILG